MGAVYADLNAVQEILGSIDPDETDMVSGLLRRASSLIRTKVNAVDQRLATGTLDPQTLSDVTADMVIRVLRNSDGVKQETIGPTAVTYDPQVASGRLFLTADELLQLQPAKAVRAGVGTIRTVPNLAPRHRFLGEGPPTAYGPNFGGEFDDSLDSAVVGPRTQAL